MKKTTPSKIAHIVLIHPVKIGGEFNNEFWGDKHNITKHKDYIKINSTYIPFTSVLCWEL